MVISLVLKQVLLRWDIRPVSYTHLSIIGIFLGNYIAYKLYLKIILELASRTMMFSSRVPIAVYALSTGVTLVIIIFVMAIMHRKMCIRDS